MGQSPQEMVYARLSDLPALVEACAVMNDAEWGDGSEESLEMRRAGFRRLALASDNEDVIVCLTPSGDLVGLAILIENELPAFPDLGPWLASLIVAPAYRGMGIAGELIWRVEDMARDLGEEAVFLYTKSPDYYNRHAYQHVDSHQMDGTTYSVLGKAL